MYRINMSTNAKQENQLKEKIWYGPSKPIQIEENMSLGKVLLECLLKDPEHIAQICCHNDKQYSNLEIANYAINFARNLKKLGFRQGDVVGFSGSNTDYVPHLFVGTQLNGLILSTLHPSLETDGIKHCLSITKPKIMFCDGEIFQKVKQAFTELKLSVPIYTMDEHIEGVPEITELFIGVGNQEPFSCDPLEKGYLATAAILFSSGTTGPPKGVCISHASLFVLGHGPLERNVKLLKFSGIAWATGLFALIASITLGITSLITKNTFSPNVFFEIINKYKPSAVFTPPSQMALLVGSKEIHKKDLSCIQSYYLFGSAAAPALVNKMKKFLPKGVIKTGYGMTELPGCFVSCNLYCGGQNMGKILPNIELKILNDDDESLGVNEAGEIVVRTQFPLSGYYGNTAATLDICDKDGWIRTGDIGYVNENEELFLIDRKKDILKYKGFYFALTEIENVITEIPDVIEVCVCGIPDEILYFLPAAMVVVKPQSALKEEDIYQYVSEKMESFKHLRGGVYFVREIPKTTSAKIIRREVLKLCEKIREEKSNIKNI